MSLSLLSQMSLAGLFTLLVLLLGSVLMVAQIWELNRRLAEQHLEREWLLSQLHFLLVTKKATPEQVQTYLTQLDRPAARLCRALLKLKNPTLERGDYLLASQMEMQRLQLERGLSHLGTIAVVSPFVGLFGTVVGITKTFADVANMGKGGIEVVSAGVAEALVATAVGLLVAIVSVVFFNFFKKACEEELVERELVGRALLGSVTSDEPDGEKLLVVDGEGDQSTKSAETFWQSATGGE